MFFSYLLYIYYLLQSYCLFLNNKAEGQKNHGVPAKLFSLTPLLLRDLFASAEGSCLRSLGGEEVFRQRNISPLTPCLLRVYFCLRVYFLSKEFRRRGGVSQAKLFSLTPLLLRDLFASAEGSGLRSLGGEEVFRWRNFSPLTPCLLRVYFCLRVYFWSKEFRRRGGVSPAKLFSFDSLPP